MLISEQTLETLEFPKIREQLARHTSFSASRELALALLPSIDAFEVAQRLRLTSEARQLLDQSPDTSIGGARDIRSPVQRAIRGGVLEANVLLEIATTLASMRRLRGQLSRLSPTVFAQLLQYAGDLPELPAIEEAIERTIGEDGNVLDSASPKLARLRRDIRVAFGRLQERLQNIISSSQYASALQEPIITIRNGRYVVPIKAAQRRSVRGLVHDQSGSGATLYIEPMAVVELNNRWRELQLAEEEEVARILSALSEQVGAAGTLIVGGVETLALLDLAFAQAKYALALRCTAPEIVERLATDDWKWELREDDLAAPLVLRAARHPLLDQSTVVPIDIWLGGELRLLLITGPNTGGKTVALKTAGLLALMAQAGLHIPVAEPSRLPIFAQIFADIGDEQSIEQSLSTFSSHMTNIIRILRALEEETESLATATWPPDFADPTTYVPNPALILLDELGAGTDPVEGAALARSIVERLLERDCMGVATTHYAELKAFAYSTPGVQNASVEFDVETLAPTYKLTIGLPGRSNALAIAARLGLDSTLVERARSTMNREDAQVEDLLAGIHRERDAAVTELQHAKTLRADAEKYRDRLAHELHEFEETRQARTEAARQEIEDELREVRSQLRRLRDEFRSVSLSRQWMEEAEQRLQETQTQVQAVLSKPTVAPTAPAQQAPRPLRVGDTVLVRSVGLQGEILAIDEEEQSADVQVGGFRMHVDLRELRREKRKAAEEPAYKSRARPIDTADASTVRLPPSSDVSMTFDMRGWRAADVADRLDHYLNDAYLAGLAQVRLIHGKGTGALRQVVRDVLQGHPLVASFGGGGADGGDGVTVAKLVDH
ncbi:MAG: endonuclease MutS2 [Chloroflexales bacterium]|nr:endonuclease MutS2 [Chloroflexales bacterium]